ncbi:MAG: RagB/SusD family nutrient uptake outer membrane protein [Bacteroidota bacterium]
MKTLYRTIFIIGILGTISSCSEELLVEDPPHILVADNLYTDLTGFEAGLNGLYAQVHWERSGLSRYHGPNDLMIDPAVNGTDNMYANYFGSFGNTANDWGTRNSSTSKFYREFWKWLYQTINAANTIINRAENPGINWFGEGGTEEENKNRVIAEARLIRAWCYRHATFMWGDVPYTDQESGSVIKSDWERTPVVEVRAKMEEDLLFAEEHLPETSENPGKVVKGVATHYLAELYLTTGDPESAKTKAQSLINSGVFSLVTQRFGVDASNPGTPFADMFLAGNANGHEGNTEALWVLQAQLYVVDPDFGFIMRRWHRNRQDKVKVNRVSGTIEYSVENGGRGIGRNGPTRYAMELYEAGDDRGGVSAWRTYEVINSPWVTLPEGWAIGDTVWHNWQGQDEKVNNPYWPSTRKWDGTDPNDLAAPRSYDDQVYLRLAETYLLLAEAELLTNGADAAAATLNILRSRSNASPVTGADVDMDFLLDERSRELYSEEHRRYTLIRTGTLFERVQRYNLIAAPNFTLRDTIYPIPQDVIDANLTHEMRQNPGY